MLLPCYHPSTRYLPLTLLPSSLPVAAAPHPVTTPHLQLSLACHCPSGTLLPSRRSLTLLAAGYTDKAAYAGVYEGVGVADGAVDTGNNAWVGMAFAHYSAATGDACYSTVAHDLLAALSKAMPCPDELQGFGSRLAPYPANYRSTEHNTDMFALSHMLGAAGAAVETRASAFVHGMWARHVGDEGKDPTYSTGTGNAMACDATVPPGPAAVNAQFSNCGHAP